MAGSLVALILLLFASPARAEDLYVETPGVARRADADNACEKIVAAGYTAQVVRRFRSGEGWEFVVRVEGLTERERALEIAGGIARITGWTTEVWVRAGREALPLQEVSPDQPPDGGSVAWGPSPQAASEGAEAKSPEAAPAGGAEAATEVVSGEGAPLTDVVRGDPVAGVELLAAVTRAHGAGVKGTALLADGRPVHFRYERKIQNDAEALRVWHDLWRRDDDLRLEVRVMEGEGTDSLAVVRGDQGAWLQARGQVHPVEPGPTRHALRVFGPEVVLGGCLDFGALGAVEGVYLAASPDPRGHRHLLVEGFEGQDAVWLAVDASDHRVRELTIPLRGETVTWRYGDYREPGAGLVVPFEIEVLRDGVSRERITVLALDLPGQADDALFDLENDVPPKGDRAD
ncbi:MAG: hypothetical protein JXB39_01420 [Deltaproteobacteria bacterium]|nr:hypothetical protein [Deltaproteobacteria bacterium]